MGTVARKALRDLFLALVYLLQRAFSPLKGRDELHDITFGYTGHQGLGGQEMLYLRELGLPSTSPLALRTPRQVSLTRSVFMASMNT